MHAWSRTLKNRPLVMGMVRVIIGVVIVDQAAKSLAPLLDHGPLGSLILPLRNPAALLGVFGGGPVVLTALGLGMVGLFCGSVTLGPRCEATFRHGCPGY